VCGTGRIQIERFFPSARHCGGISMAIKNFCANNHATFAERAGSEIFMYSAAAAAMLKRAAPKTAASISSSQRNLQNKSSTKRLWYLQIIKKFTWKIALGLQQFV
jgi:hypothetical protein